MDKSFNYQLDSSKRNAITASVKSALFSFAFLTIIFGFFYSKSYWTLDFLLIFLVCFVFCYRIVFNFWFGRAVEKCRENEINDLDGYQMMCDHINTTNGYPPGLNYIMPKSSIK